MKCKFWSWFILREWFFSQLFDILQLIFCLYTEYQRFEKKEILWQKAWGLNPWHLFTEPRLYPLSHQDHVCNQLCLGNLLQQVVTLSWTQLTNWIIVCFDDCLTCNNELSLICFGKVNCLRRIQTCCCS